LAILTAWLLGLQLIGQAAAPRPIELTAPQESARVHLDTISGHVPADSLRDSARTGGPVTRDSTRLRPAKKLRTVRPWDCCAALRGVPGGGQFYAGRPIEGAIFGSRN